MFFRRSRHKTSEAPCQSCARIRAFLAVAGILIIAMPLFGEKAAPLAKLTPMGIALAMMGVGSIAFVLRWIAWRREEARNRELETASHIPDPDNAGMTRNAEP